MENAPDTDHDATLPDPGPLPDPSPHVVDAPQATDAHGGSQAVEPSTKIVTDGAGNAHNPAIHESPPRIAVRTGQWARLRGGAAQSKSRVKPNHMRSIADEPVVVAETAQSSTDYAAQGKMFAGLFFHVGQVVAGDDMKPDQGEEDALAQAAAKFAESRQMKDIPPGWALAIVAGSIVAKRWNRPRVAELRASLFARIKSWLAHRYIDTKIGKDPARHAD